MQVSLWVFSWPLLSSWFKVDGEFQLGLTSVVLLGFQGGLCRASQIASRTGRCKDINHQGLPNIPTFTALHHSIVKLCLGRGIEHSHLNLSCKSVGLGMCQDNTIWQIWWRTRTSPGLLLLTRVWPSLQQDCSHLLGLWLSLINMVPGLFKPVFSVSLHLIFLLNCNSDVKPLLR